MFLLPCRRTVLNCSYLLCIYIQSDIRRYTRHSGQRENISNLIDLLYAFENLTIWHLMP